MNRLLSEVVITGSDYQAFRAGFREGVKLNLADGKIAYEAYPDLPLGEALCAHVGPRNLERLKVWCSVGADVARGDWAIFGARLGCVMTALEGFDIAKVANYDWVNYFWEQKIAPIYSDNRARDIRSRELRGQLNEALNLGIDDLGPDASAQFKLTFQGHRAYGAMRIVSPA